jgi:hypothetical protein
LVLKFRYVSVSPHRDQLLCTGQAFDFNDAVVPDFAVSRIPEKFVVSKHNPGLIDGVPADDFILESRMRLQLSPSAHCGIHESLVARLATNALYSDLCGVKGRFGSRQTFLGLLACIAKLAGGNDAYSGFMPRFFALLTFDLDHNVLPS